MADFTPGPWKVEKCSCGHPSCKRYGLSVGMFPQGAGFDLADATLAAAAPDLLEALECLLPGLILDLRYASDDDDKEAMRSRIKTVTDALAKTIVSSNDTSK